MNAQSASVSFARGAQSATRPVSLTARQLSEVELGLFLLSQLTPSAPPAFLPALLAGEATPESAAWTVKQQKYLNRARLVLSGCRQPTGWNRLVRRYAALAGHLAAYDVSRDQSRFRPKSVGFFRNRAATFRQMLA